MNLCSLGILPLLFFFGPAFHSACAETGPVDPTMKDLPDWRSDWSFQSGAGAYATRKGPIIRIGNVSLERVFRVVNDSFGTIQLVNKVSGREPGSQQWGEFGLVLSGAVSGEFTAPDFQLAGIALESGNDPRRVQFTLQRREQPSLTVQITIETLKGAKYQRKWLTVSWAGEGDVMVDRIDVESTGGLGWWYIGNPSHLGMGQPLFAADLFMGLEYPAGEVTEEYLRHFPGRSAKGGLVSKSAVWGVARNAASVRDAFFADYLYALDVKPEQPFVIWNLIGTGTPEEAALVHWMEVAADRAKTAGFAVDSFAVDDVWQDYTTVWQPDPARFPHGLEPLTQTMDRLGSRLGLWLSLPGCSLDTRWAKLHNLEVSQVGFRGPTGGRYCLAGPRYKAELKRVLVEYLVKNKVNYFKCDYNSFGCEDTSHGHGLGPAGREAQIDAFLEVLRHIKTVSPECRIALTSGMWLSPWWCLYADYIWLGGNDMEVNKEVRNLTQQDGAITYRDSVMYEDFVEKKYVFPFSSLMTHGFWEMGDASYEKFRDDVMMTIGRGIAKWEILNSPNSMDDKRCAFLGRVLQWGKANWDILSNTQMILGDPRKGEVYGYSHIGRKAALLFLRNPDIESKLIDVSLHAMGVAPEDPLEKVSSPKALEVYPAYHELDWEGAPAAPLKPQILGSETKCIAIAADASLLEPLKL